MCWKQWVVSIMLLLHGSCISKSFMFSWHYSTGWILLNLLVSNMSTKLHCFKIKQKWIRFDSPRHLRNVNNGMYEKLVHTSQPFYTQKCFKNCSEFEKKGMSTVVNYSPISMSYSSWNSVSIHMKLLFSLAIIRCERVLQFDSNLLKEI